jgi:hypothetical protein
MMGIQYVGLAGMVFFVSLLAVVNWPRRESFGRCAGCDERLPFDGAINDYPEACSACLEDLYETARREMQR